MRSRNDEVLAVRRHMRADAPATLQIFREAVHRGAAERYSGPERHAWAPADMDPADWALRRAAHSTWVAERLGEVVGFSGLTAEGAVDMLYVHPDHTRHGVARALLDEVERCAREANLARLHTHASLVAEPVFTRAGFVVMHRQSVERRGQRLARALMEKLLEPV